jgi:hypothetical protein
MLCAGRPRHRLVVALPGHGRSSRKSSSTGMPILARPETLLITVEPTLGSGLLEDLVAKAAHPGRHSVSLPRLRLAPVCSLRCEMAT